MTRRIFKLNADSLAGLEVTDGSAKLSGNNDNLVYADDSGVYLVGNISMLAEPQNMKIASMFRYPTAYEMMIPSTSVTPRPMLIPDPPIEGFTSVATAVVDFISELL